MGYVTYQDSKGQKFKIPEGVPFKKGADWVEVEGEHNVEAELNDTISKLAGFVGLSVDETITKLAKVLNIPKCASCQKRGLILREMGKLGWIETAKRLKATFKTKQDA